MKSVKKVGVIGIPFCKGQPRNGTEKGPEALRGEGLIKKLLDIGCHVTDHGDVEVAEIEKDVPEKKVKNPRTVGKTSEWIADKVEKVLKSRETCLALGGDHSMAIGSIAGHARVEPNLVVIWIDAHADDVRKRKHPRITAKDIAYIGLRDVDPGERKIIEEFSIAAFSMQEVDQYGINDVVDRALLALDPDGKRPIHLSFDVDGMNPTLTPSTGTPVIGGLSLRETYYIAEEVASTEVNPLLGDEKDKKLTVDMTINVIQRFFSSRCEGCYPHGYEIPSPLTTQTW